MRRLAGAFAAAVVAAPGLSAVRPRPSRVSSHGIDLSLHRAERGAVVPTGVVGNATEQSIGALGGGGHAKEHLLQSGERLPPACCSQQHERCPEDPSGHWRPPRCEVESLLVLLKFLKTVFAGSGADPGIRWHLHFGTLLGAVRNGAFIPHESDLDIGVEAAQWSDAKARILKGISDGGSMPKSDPSLGSVDVGSFWLEDGMEQSSGSGTLPSRLYFSSANLIHLTKPDRTLQDCSS